MIPESSSLWPIRVLGDPKWLSNHLHTWHGRIREPVAVARSIWYDWHVASYLYRLVRSSKPGIVIETGVHIGKSSTAILAALHRNQKGVLISIDLPKNGLWKDADGFEDVSWVRTPGETGKLVPASLRYRWSLKLGDAKVMLPKLLNKLGTTDLFYHDSEHSYEHQQFEYNLAWSYLRNGGVLCSDDTDRSTAWQDFLIAKRITTDDNNGLGLPKGPGAIRAVRKIGD